MILYKRTGFQGDFQSVNSISSKTGHSIHQHHSHLNIINNIKTLLQHRAINQINPSTNLIIDTTSLSILLYIQNKHQPNRTLNNLILLLFNTPLRILNDISINIIPIDLVTTKDIILNTMVSSANNNITPTDRSNIINNDTLTNLLSNSLDL